MKKFFYVVILFIIIVISLIISINIFINKDILSNKKIISKYSDSLEIINHYNKYVKVNNESTLYKMENNELKEIGKVNKDINLELDDIHKNYYKIKNLNYYIEYKNVDKIDNYEVNDRYKRYVPFNQNAVTTNKTIFYNDKGYAYEIDESISLPIIIKDTDKYYVEYNNSLVYVNKDDVKVINKHNTDLKTRNNIRTFTYHAVYKDGETCKNTSICHPYKQFDSHMKYLYDNNYLTLTMEELEMFLDKKINIPTKTVVITLDDGNLAKNAIEVLEKYKLYATYFVITGRYDAYKIETKYVKFESHTDNLHNNYKCPGGEQGGQLLCEDEDKVIKDLKLSQEKLGESHYFSYPFFDWNQRAFKILKQCGFRLAFLGQLDTEGYSDYNTNRLMLRRKTIFYNDSLETFISYLK